MQLGKVVMILGVLLLAGYCMTGYAMRIAEVAQVILEDSEEDFSRRIYSYDFGVDSGGNLHVIYAKPATSGNTNRCVIYYTHGSMDDLKQNTTVICDDGKLGSISTFLLIDPQDTVHVCYIKHQNDPDTSLYYRQITSNGRIGEEEYVAAGGWHTKMSLDTNNMPIFARDDDYYPRLIQSADDSWISSTIFLTTPANSYSLCDFECDPNTEKMHITFADKIVLSDRCPWGVTTCNGTYFSKFHYACSDDGIDWNESTIYDSARLWEYEFWTSLLLDKDGTPYASMLDMNPDYEGYPPNVKLLWGGVTNEQWQTEFIAGTNCPGTQATGGMGAKMAIDMRGGFWSAWDNSPAFNCTGMENPGADGNTMIGYSSDGVSWHEIQQAEPFSAEGYCRVFIHKNSFYILWLGNHTDTKLYLNQYDLNNLSILSNSLPVVGDFDGDGKAGYGIYYPPTGLWQINRTSEGVFENNFGFEGTEPITGDFDGDGKLDFGCYYPPTGWWYIYKSSGGFWTVQFGYAGTIPFTGDFDGDGEVDFGCYFPPDGWWYIFQSRDGFRVEKFGYAGTEPICGQFDGDPVRDFGCYYPPTGWWYIYKSSGGFWTTQFGYEKTVPFTGNFDGDEIGDFGCYYPPGGWWYFYTSQEGFYTSQFGFSGTLPVTADFDGDSITDYACFDPGSGNWFMQCSTLGFKVEQSVVY